MRRFTFASPVSLAVTLLSQCLTITSKRFLSHEALLAFHARFAEDKRPVGGLCHGFSQTALQMHLLESSHEIDEIVAQLDTLNRNARSSQTFEAADAQDDAVMKNFFGVITDYQLNQTTPVSLNPHFQDLRDMGGLCCIKQFTGCYDTLEKLTHMLTVLRAVFSSQPLPVGMLVADGEHVINLNFDLAKVEWVFYDTNHLPVQRFQDDAALAATLRDALLGKNGVAVLRSEIYTTGRNAAELTTHLEATLTASSDWQHMHQPAAHDVQEKNSHGFTRLHAACRVGDTALVKDLLAHFPVNPDLCDDAKRPLLYYAVRSNTIATVQALLDAGAKVPSEAENLARRMGNIEMATLLAQRIEKQQTAAKNETPKSKGMLASLFGKTERTKHFYSSAQAFYEAHLEFHSGRR